MKLEIFLIAYFISNCLTKLKPYLIDFHDGLFKKIKNRNEKIVLK